MELYKKTSSKKKKRHTSLWLRGSLLFISNLLGLVTVVERRPGSFYKRQKNDNLNTSQNGVLTDNVAYG